MGEEAIIKMYCNLSAFHKILTKANKQTNRIEFLYVKGFVSVLIEIPVEEDLICI